TSPGKILAGNLLYRKNGIKIAKHTTVNNKPSAESQMIEQIIKEINAIIEVPEPSPLYPSSMFTVLANTATIKGARIGYITFNLNFPKKGIVGDSI
ncbi:unnamed protein product, partial [marine sediment metagenome]